MKKLVLICSLIALCGCATSYQQQGVMGGFSETELSPNYFRITFKGNAYTSREKVSDYALLRASELMIQRGCKSFQVIGNNQYIKSNYSISPQSHTTNASAYTYGNYIHGNATTTSYGGNIQTVSRASTNLDVQCVDVSANPSIGVFDSQFMNNSLKSKYKISEK